MRASASGELLPLGERAQTLPASLVGVMKAGATKKKMGHVHSIIPSQMFSKAAVF